MLRHVSTYQLQQLDGVKTHCAVLLVDTNGISFNGFITADR